MEATKAKAHTMHVRARREVRSACGFLAAALLGRYPPLDLGLRISDVPLGAERAAAEHKRNGPLLVGVGVLSQRRDGQVGNGRLSAKNLHIPVARGHNLFAVSAPAAQGDDFIESVRRLRVPAPGGDGAPSLCRL